MPRSSSKISGNTKRLGRSSTNENRSPSKAIRKSLEFSKTKELIKEWFRKLKNKFKREAKFMSQFSCQSNPRRKTIIRKATSKNLEKNTARLKSLKERRTSNSCKLFTGKKQKK